MLSVAWVAAIVYPAIFITANAVLDPNVHAPHLANTGCGTYDELETISAIQGLDCFFVDLFVNSQQLERKSRVQ